MHKRKINRALVVALSVAMASGNVTPTISYAAESAQVQEMVEQKEDVSDEPQEKEKTVVKDTHTFEYVSEDGNYSLKYQFHTSGDDVYAIITGYGLNRQGRNIVIPEKVSAPAEDDQYVYTDSDKYQDITVKIIFQNAFAGSDCPTSVVIPACVESIGTNAFTNGSSSKDSLLESVTIAEKSQLKDIGEFAFQNQAKLSSSLIIPAGVKKIGQQAFYGCKGLTDIQFLGGETIEKEAFSGCTNVKGGLKLPNSVITVGDSAFASYGKAVKDAKDFGSLVLSDKLESIGKSAFSGAKFVGDLTIPKTVKDIGSSAFSSAFSNKDTKGTLTFEVDENNSSSLTEIPASAFNSCIGFNGDLKIPDSIVSVGERAFGGCNCLDGKITLSKALTTIGNSAFATCEKLTGDLTIPDTVTKIGANAFSGCSALNGKLTISANITKIENSTFENCTNLRGDLSVPEGVTEIGSSAFAGCESMNGTLTLPETVTKIGSKAFSGCSSLKGDLKIPSVVTIIDSSVFSGCSSFTNLSMPDGITQIKDSAFSGCTGFENEFVIPAKVTSIGKSAFNGCSKMKGNLVIPNGVTSVGDYAFQGMTGLTGYLYLPETLTTFGIGAFKNCANIKNQEDENGKPINIEIAYNTTSLPQDLFYGCSSLLHIQLPKTITKVNSGAFAQTNAGMHLYVYTHTPAADAVKAISSNLTSIHVHYIDSLDGIILSSDKMTMRVGCSRPISAKIRYYKYDETTQTDSPMLVDESDATDKLTWSTANKDQTASYENGKVTAKVATSNDKVVVTSADGKTSAICALEILNNYVTKVALDSTAAVTYNTSKDNQETEVKATITLKGLQEAIYNNEIKTEDLSVEFKSSVDGIVKIEQGEISFNDDLTEAYVTAKITPLKSGTANVYVEATVAGDAKAQKTSNRKFTVVVPLQSISIPETATVKVGGEKLKLAATLNPEGATTQKVTWKSSDTSVATINSTTGEITAKKAGTVTITCTPSNNSNYGDTAEAVTCTLTVLPKDGTTPTPTPDPKPNPNPDPKPTPDPKPNPTPTPEVKVPTMSVSYRTHVQTFGWEKSWSKDGAMSGTSGKAKRLEGIEINVSGNDKVGIQYTTHCQSYGWLPWSSNGDMSGTEGEAKRLEAIKIQLTGADKDKYDIYYRVHAQSYGWLGWAKNGAPAGTAGYAKRLEGIQIVIVKKGEKIDENKNGIKSVNKSAYIALSGTSPVVNSKPTSSMNPTIEGNSTPNVTYRTHVQTYGWQGWKFNGSMSGTSGQAKRLEGIEIKLTNKPYSGGISYTTHVQSYGWQGNVNNPSTWRSNGAMSGTSGEAKRLEAICITLTGKMAEHYDIYYRVHAQTFGWLDWAKNGAPAGTAGYAKRLEGIEIKLVPKGGVAPGKTARPYVSK